MLVNVARKKRVQRRSADDASPADRSIHLTMPSAISCNSSIEAASQQLQLHLQPSYRLLDDAFVYIRRYENASVLIDDFRPMADGAAPCFYRDVGVAAVDICERNVVS